MVEVLLMRMVCKSWLTLLQLVFLSINFHDLLSSVDVKGKVGEGSERGNVLFLKERKHIFFHLKRRCFKKERVDHHLHHQFSPKN